MRDTAQQKFKTDSHLSQGCRKPRIRPACRMQGEIAVLIFTRTPAGCKSYKCIGRSSDLFRFYAFPALRPVAKIVKPFAPHVWGRNSQQRVLSQILTAFPFHSSSRNRRFGNLCDGKYTNILLVRYFRYEKNAILYFGNFTVMNQSYLSDLRF